MTVSMRRCDRAGDDGVARGSRVSILSREEFATLWQRHGRIFSALAAGTFFAAALVDIDTAIAAHRKEFDHGDRPCATMMCLRRTRAMILAKLGREREARAAREAAAVPPSVYPVTSYELFHRRLDKLFSQGSGKGPLHRS